jgi:hypothetical protein
VSFVVVVDKGNNKLLSFGAILISAQLTKKEDSDMREKKNSDYL